MDHLPLRLLPHKVAELEKELNSATQRYRHLSQVCGPLFLSILIQPAHNDLTTQTMEEEIKSKEALASQLSQTNEKMREMRRIIAFERFGRAAQTTLADV